MKTISILGDSLSTFELMIPKGHITFYDSFNAHKTGVASADDTWWGMLVKDMGLELLVNNSFSGSRVAKMPDWDLFPSGCSPERAQQLHKGERDPDIIIVYLGTNDWGFGIPIVHDTEPICGFAFAYEEMLRLITERYPNSEVFCCTLGTNYIATSPDVPFRYALGGLHMEWYNDIIIEIAKKFKTKIIDLYKMPPYTSIEGAHADKNGMRIIAQNIKNGILNHT